MHRLIPDLRVYPYQLIDGGNVVLRAHFTLHLAALTPQASMLGVAGILNREMVVDLFEPPQRVALRERVMDLRARGKTEREAAKELGITHTTAQRAAALTRKMKELKITDPYVRLDQPDAASGKLRRYLHPRYHFQPLEEIPAATQLSR
jgi:hypothetical protein